MHLLKCSQIKFKETTNLLEWDSWLLILVTRMVKYWQFGLASDPKTSLCLDTSWFYVLLVHGRTIREPQSDQPLAWFCCSPTSWAAAFLSLLDLNIDPEFMVAKWPIIPDSLCTKLDPSCPSVLQPCPQEIKARWNLSEWSPTLAHSSWGDGGKCKAPPGAC